MARETQACRACGKPLVHPGLTERGLTKREYFAALAMQGQITNAEILVRYGLYAADVARAAVEQADALIAALNKESQP